MSSIHRLLLALTLMVPAATRASSVLGDNILIDGDLNGEVIGPVAVTAAAGVPETVSLPSADVVVEWVDDDSFEVTIQGLTSAFDFALGLSDLDFLAPGSVPVNITGASFNVNDSSYLTYLFDPVNNPTGSPRPGDPSVSFAAHSVTIQYGSDWSGQLAADWPTLRFDIKTASPGGGPSVPDAGGTTLGMLAAALGLIACRSRSERR